MPTATFDNVTLTTKANVYFDGKCVSHSFTTRLRPIQSG